MGDRIKIPLEVCCFLAELFKMQGNTTEELVDSTKERNAAHKMTRLVDKGAQKHSESQAVTNLSVSAADDKEHLSAWFPDPREKPEPTCLRNSALRQVQQTCLAVPLQISKKNSQT